MKDTITNKARQLSDVVVAAKNAAAANAAAAKNAMGSCLPGATDKNRAGKPNNTVNDTENKSGQVVDGEVISSTPPSGQGEDVAGTTPGGRPAAEVKNLPEENNRTIPVATNNGSEGQDAETQLGEVTPAVEGEGTTSEAGTPTVAINTTPPSGDSAVGDSAVGAGTPVENNHTISGATNNGSEGQGAETQLGQGDNGAGAVGAHDQVETKSSLWDYMQSFSFFSSCCNNRANNQNDSDDEIRVEKTPSTDAREATGASMLSREGTSMSA